jgi:hypothetical protein
MAAALPGYLNDPPKAACAVTILKGLAALGALEVIPTLCGFRSADGAPLVGQSAVTVGADQGRGGGIRAVRELRLAWRGHDTDFIYQHFE